MRWKVDLEYVEAFWKTLVILHSCESSETSGQNVVHHRVGGTERAPEISPMVLLDDNMQNR